MKICKKPMPGGGKSIKRAKKKSSFLKIIFLVLLFFLPLYPKFPLAEVEGTYVAIRLEDWVILACLLVWGFWQLRNNWPIFKEKIFKLFLLYWLIGLLSLISALFLTRTVDFRLGMFHLLRRVEYMSLFWLARDAFRFTSLEELSFSLSLVIFLVFAYGLGQKFFGFPVISTMNAEFSKGLVLRLDEWTRISSTFAGHYDLAAWLAMVLALLPALVFKAKKRLFRAWLILVGASGFYLLILTASRISYVAYLVGITLTILLLRRWLWLPLVLVVSLFFGFQSKELNTRLASTIPAGARAKLALILKRETIPSSAPAEVILPVEEEQSPAPKPSGEGKGKEEEKKVVFREARTWPKPEEVAAAAARSSQIRFQVEWPRAFRALVKNPFLGTGYSSLGLATDNDYLRLLGETGLLGFLSFGLIIFHLLRKGLESLFKKRNLAISGFLGLILALLANAVFIDVLEASKVAYFFWLLTGVMYHLIVKSEKLKVKS